MTHSTREASRLSRSTRITFAALGVAALTALSITSAPAAHAADLPVTDEASLLAALASAADGDVLRVQTSFTVTTPLEVSSNLTLNLDTHTVETGSIQIAPSTMFRVNGTTGQLIATASTQHSAAIGNSEATFVVDGGTVVAHGSDYGAAVGGHVDVADTTDVVPQSAGQVTVNGGHLIAHAGAWSAGIGGADRGSGGALVVNGGLIEAYGSSNAPAIGTGGGIIAGGHAGSIVMNGGEIRASSVTNSYAAVIGSSTSGNPVGPSVGLNRGAITVTNLSPWGAGIGGGAWQAGGTLAVGEPASVTISGQRPVGAGYGHTQFGTLTVGGTLTIDSALHILPSASAEVRATGTLGGTGSLTGDGTLTNLGAITLENVNVVDDGGTLTVTDNNYLVTFDPAVSGASSADVRVFAPTFAAGARAFPADPVDAPRVFDGWRTPSDDPFTETTPLSGDLTVTAAWATAATDVPGDGELAPTGSAAGGVTLLGLALLALGLVFVVGRRSLARV